MLKFKTKKELQNCEELQNMCRYEWQIVKLNGEDVIACTTNQQYEDIVWGGINEMLEELMNYYEREDDITDITSEIRDYVYNKLEEVLRIKFVDVFDEY